MSLKRTIPEQWGQHNIYTAKSTVDHTNYLNMLQHFIYLNTLQHFIQQLSHHFQRICIYACTLAHAFRHACTHSCLHACAHTYTCVKLIAHNCMNTNTHWQGIQSPEWKRGALRADLNDAIEEECRRESGRLFQSNGAWYKRAHWPEDLRWVAGRWRSAQLSADERNVQVFLSEGSICGFVNMYEAEIFSALNYRFSVHNHSGSCFTSE